MKIKNQRWPIRDYCRARDYFFEFIHIVAVKCQSLFHYIENKHDYFCALKLQIIQDSKGKTTGVYIPINEWKELKKQYKDLEALECEEPTKAQLLLELKEAVAELTLIEKGKLKARPARALLDEL